MKSVSHLVFGSMTDKRSSMSSYYDRLQNLDVNKPETYFVSSNIDKAVDEIYEIMTENSWKKSFVRTSYKAAPQRLDKGSLINKRSKQKIRTTLESLQIQLSNSVWDVGENFILRERLDTDFCMNPSHPMDHPEVRFFIEGGEVIGRYPEDIAYDSICEKRYDYLKDIISNSSPPVEEAKIVAEEFDEYPWCVDFALTEEGVWYCLELNFNGVRWDEERQEWVNMCGYGNKTYKSPEVIHSPVLSKYKKQNEN